MTVLQTETFEAGTIGQAVQEAETIFTNVDNVGITYVTGLVGAKACNVAPATTGACRNSGFTAMPKAVIRFQFRFSALPTADAIIAHACKGDPNAGGSRIAHIYLTAAGKIQIRDVYSSPVSSTATLAINTTYAVEWQVDPSTNSQSLRFFTNVATTASPAETLTGTASGAVVDDLDWIQVGKMTNTTWTGGLTFDEYQRADDWIATPVAALWDEEFAGTVGANITTNANIAEVHNTAPVVAAGGPHVDQKYASFAATSAIERWIRATQIGAGAAANWERFYARVPVAPTSDTEEYAIWQAASTGDVEGLSLVVRQGSGATVNLALYLGLDYQSFGVEPPLAEIPGLGVNEWFRVDVACDNSGADPAFTIDIFAGAAKHLTGSANRLGRLTGTATVGGQRRRRLCQRAVLLSGPVPAVHFDSWKLSTTSAPGPLATSDQFDEPVGVQWAFSEWNGTTETPLTLVGVSVGGATTEAINIGNTEIYGESASALRFSGDPGEGKLLLGWNSYGTNWAYHYSQQGKIRAVTPPSPYVAASDFAGGHYRIFADTFDEIFGNHSDATWLEGRQAAANCDIVCVSYDIATNAKINDMTAGVNYEAWLDTLAVKIQDVYDRYGAAIHITLGNELEQGPKGHQDDNTFWKNTRKGARYIHFSLLNRGVSRDAFEVTTSTPFSMSAYDHVANWTRHKNDGYPTSGTATNGASFALYQMHPDWKGTITTAGGTYWQTGWDPNPADFHMPGTNAMDEWGYGRGPILRVWACNSYCDHGWQGALWSLTDAQYEGHVFSDADQGYTNGGHGGGFQKFLRGLYGPKGLPIHVNEWGYYGRDSATSVDLAKTMRAAERYVPDLIADNVVGISWWRNDEPSSVPSFTFAGDPGPHSFGYRKGNGTFYQVDGAAQFDMNRKMYSAMFQQPGVVGPQTTGPDAPSKPRATQHN